MRKVMLTAALVTLLALPVLAQFRGGFGRGGFGGQDAVMNKSVQAELKLDDKQKDALAEIQKKNRESMTKAFEYFKEKEFDKGKEAMTKVREETAKAIGKFREGLTSTQKKRLTECEVQIATKRNDVHIFKNPAVEKILKLSDKQKDKVKETISDLDKDRREVFEEAGKDKEGRRKAFEKAQQLSKDAFAKITKDLSEDQAKAWKDAAGEKFEYKEDQFKGGPGKGGKGKKNRDKKDKDDL